MMPSKVLLSWITFLMFGLLETASAGEMINSYYWQCSKCGKVPLEELLPEEPSYYMYMEKPKPRPKLYYQCAEGKDGIRCNFTLHSGQIYADEDWLRSREVWRKSYKERQEAKKSLKKEGVLTKKSSESHQALTSSSLTDLSYGSSSTEASSNNKNVQLGPDANTSNIINNLWNK